MGREADFKHQKSLLTLSSCEYRQDHNLIFLHDTFISKDVSQNSKSFLLGLILTNLGGKIPNSKKYIFFKSGPQFAKEKILLSKESKISQVLQFVFAEVNNMRYNNS